MISGCYGTMSKSSARLLTTKMASEQPDSSVENGNTWNAQRDAILIGPCPHTWLFQKVKAVCHHGGAGRVFY